MKKAYIIIGLIFSCLYLYYYLLGQPLWLDECLLAFAIQDVSYSHLFLPLPYQQVAPPLFLVISKWIYGWGVMPVEYRLRLFPIICGIGSVWIFIPFIKKFIKEKSLILISFLLFCSNLWIPSYAQEFKQYGPDIFFGMVAYLLCQKVMTLQGYRSFLGGLLLGVLALSSQITIFIVVAYVGSYILCRLNIKSIVSNKEVLKKSCLIFLGWIIPVGIMVFLQYRNNPNRQFMTDWWTADGGFIEFNFISISQWFSKNIDYLFLLSKLKIYWIFAPIMIVQLIAVKENGKIKFENVFLFLLFLGVLLASYLKLYPATERVILWTYPFMIMILMRFVERFYQFKICRLFKYFFMMMICCYISVEGYKTDIIEGNVAESIVILKEKTEVIPVYIKRYVKYRHVKNLPDFGAVYTFYKKLNQYQPSEEVIFEDGYIMIRETDAECHEIFDGQFESGKTYGFIGFEDKLSKECQNYFWQFNGKMEGPVYIWTHP